MRKGEYAVAAAPVAIGWDGAATIARLACTTCGRGEEWRIGSRLPPIDVLHKHFIRRGWALTRRPLCEFCQAVKRRKPTMKIITPPAAITAAKPADTLPSPAARNAKVLLYLALDEYYDAANRCYRAGKSDKVLAEEVGCAEDLVRKTREADFGPLGEPDEVRALRAELGVVLAQVAKGREQVAAIEAKFAVLAQRNGWAV